MPLGLKNKNGYTACHHHQGQNRPHQKTITYPHDPPQPPVENAELLGRGEGIVYLHSPVSLTSR